MQGSAVALPMRAYAMMLACLLMAGCMGGDETTPTPTPSTAAPTPTPEATPTPPTNQTPTPPTEPTPPTNATPTPPTNQTPPTPPPPVTIAILNIAQGFSPATLTVPAGTEVTWENQDAALPHTATADDGSWDTGNVAPGGSASLVLDAPGTYPYHCALHPSMTATITVEA